MADSPELNQEANVSLIARFLMDEFGKLLLYELSEGEAQTKARRLLSLLCDEHPRAYGPTDPKKWYFTYSPESDEVRWLRVSQRRLDALRESSRATMRELQPVLAGIFHRAFKRQP